MFNFLGSGINPILINASRLWYFNGFIAKYHEEQFVGNICIVIEDCFNGTANIYKLAFRKTNIYVKGERFVINISSLASGEFTTPQWAFSRYTNAGSNQITFRVNFNNGDVTLTGRGQNTSNVWGSYSAKSNFKTSPATLSKLTFNTHILPHITTLGYKG